MRANPLFFFFPHSTHEQNSIQLMSLSTEDMHVFGDSELQEGNRGIQEKRLATESFPLSFFFILNGYTKAIHSFHVDV